MSPNDVNRDVT